MAASTWWNITHGMNEALHKSYMHKSGRQRRKREVAYAWENSEDFCKELTALIESGEYKVGEYRHFNLRDKKKVRSMSVLPFRDRCVQNNIKDAFEPLALRRMTDDMLGGLPGRGVLVKGRYGVVSQMRRLMNDASITHYIKADIAKFYDNIDNVIVMQAVERFITDKRTLAIIRQHLFKQKKLAIGDPFSHLMANTVMSSLVRTIKAKHPNVRLVNFADDLFIGGHSDSELKEVRITMKSEAAKMRLHFHTIHIHPLLRKPIIFCGYQFGRGFVKLSQRTKKAYIKSRHRKLSMGSYNGILQVADTKHLRTLIERKDDRHMTDKTKIRRPFAGRPMKIETMEGITHTIVDFVRKPSQKKDCDYYYHVQAIANGLGLVVYSTGASKIAAYLNERTVADIPLRDLKIVHDWSGYYYEGTVYSDAEEEKMIRDQYNIHT